LFQHINIYIRIYIYIYIYHHLSQECFKWCIVMHCWFLSSRCILFLSHFRFIDWIHWDLIILLEMDFYHHFYSSLAQMSLYHFLYSEYKKRERKRASERDRDRGKKELRRLISFSFSSRMLKLWKNGSFWLKVKLV